MAAPQPATHKMLINGALVDSPTTFGVRSRSFDPLPALFARRRAPTLPSVCVPLFVSPALSHPLSCLAQVINPATGEVFAYVPDVTKEQADEAVSDSTFRCDPPTHELFPAHAPMAPGPVALLTCCPIDLLLC
jgi:acyl-CoA reductase-like NAD-dependent aldehyde dehydrogenase